MKIKMKNYARQLWLSLLLLVGVAAIAVPGLNGTNSGGVAQIGEGENVKKFETLEAAFAAANDGETITVLADCAGNGIVTPQGKFTTGLTVDFAGHTYTVDGATVGSAGTETNGFQLLKDNKITFKGGTITSEKAKILVQNYSDLTLEGMTLTLNNANYASAYTLSNNCGNVVISNTTITANPAGGFAFDVCRYSSYPSVSVTVTGNSEINGNVEVFASGSDAKDGFKLMLEAGTLNGNIVLDASAKAAMAAAPEKALVMKSETFTKDAPADYKWVAAEGGTQKLVPCEYVAQIGEGENVKKFETLEAAFAAANDGETITVLADCAGNGIVTPQGKFTTGLTVDFAGHTYTVDGATVGSAGTETNGFQLLKDNKITFKGGTITSEKAKILVQNYSDLTLEGMTLTLNNANYTAGYTLSNNNGNVVIDGTTINANPAGGFAFDVCRYSSYPSVSVTVKGESVINGNVEVFASGSDAKDGFKLMLEAGTMTGNIVLDASAKAAMAAAPDKALVMKKETFTKDAPADYKWVAAEGGTQKLVPCEYVAQIGEGENVKKFETLEAAFAAANDGETITVLADCAGNGIVTPQGKFTTGLTVDFAGHTYTVDGTTVGSAGTETNGFQLLKDNKITFKNGTITSEKAKILVQNYSDLTLEGMTLTLNNANYTQGYTLSNNNGTVVIDGTTINANPAGGFAFDVCRYESYPSVNVTVKGESVINGNIEVFASNKDPKDGFGLTLEAGTFNGNIVLDASAEAVLNATPEKAVIKKNNSLTTVVAPQDYKWVDNSDGTSTLKPCEYVAQYNNVKFETLQAALDAAEADNPQDIVIDLLGDATLDITAWSGTKNPLAIGTESTKSITINGNSHTLTFNQKDSDWNNVATMNDAETKLILNDMALTSSGYNNGPWNRHDINFNCAVELNNVTSDKALAFKNDATLKNVTVTDTSGSLYGIWIQPNGQNVRIDGLTVTAERGIKIDDEYVDNPEQVTLSITNASFKTTKKSAILVKSAAETVITAGEGINIDNVTADNVNLVWVDEDRAEEFYKVTVEGATIMPESNESDYVACLMKGEQRWGFYKVLSKAIDNVEGGYSIKLHQTTTEAVEVSKQLTITKNGFKADNVTAGEGYKRFESETEIVISSFNPICAIGDNKYETLAEAVAAAGNSEATITLLTEAATDGVISGAGVVVPSGSNITFDLNGLTYNVSGETVGSSTTETQGFQLLKNSNITFKNGTLKATSPTAQMVIQNYSNLTLKDVNVDGTGLSGWAYALSNNCGTINLTGSTSITAKEGGRAFDTCKFGDYAIPTVNINTTGVISGPIEATGGKLNIENGKFDVTWVTDSHYAAGDIQITGGVFTEKPAEEYCAEGYIPTTNNDEATKADYPYAVKIGTFICAIGDNKYETLAEAVAAAGTSEATITLLTEAATDGVISGAGVVVPSGSNITFDLNGLTYNVSGETVGSSTTETQGFQLLKNSNITFKNGTLKATSPTAQMVIQNYSNLTLEDVNVDGTGLSGWAYALSNNCGTINLTGSTSITAKEGGRAFDTCKFGSYAIPTVNINTTGVISGPIEATGGKLNIENGKFDVTWVTDNNYAAGDIQIKGGVFSAEPAEEYCADGFITVNNEDEATKALYPYTVVNDDEYVFELIDQEVYELNKAKTFKHVTYTRTFNNTNWQSLFVPFDINVEDYADKYEFAKIHMIAFEKDDNGFTSSSKIVVSYTKVTSGTLYANKPYLIKAKSTGTDVFVLENVTLKGCNDIKPIECNTTHADYSIVGSYQPVTATTENPYMAMAGGTINWYQSRTIKPFRWVIRVSPKDDDYARPNIELVEDDDITGISTMFLNNDDIEGYYTVNGVRNETPVKGINIIRYKNGQTKKVVIK